MPFFPMGINDPPLHVIIQALQLDFNGMAHRGIDDCHAIVLSLKAMLIKGHQFENPVIITDNYDPYMDPTFLPSASTAPENSWKCPYCDAKFSASETDFYRAIWNKPFLSNCRFCNSPRPST